MASEIKKLNPEQKRAVTRAIARATAGPGNQFVTCEDGVEAQAYRLQNSIRWSFAEKPLGRIIARDIMEKRASDE